MTNSIFLTAFIVSLIITIVLIYVSIYKSDKLKNVYYTLFLIHLFIYLVGSILEITAISMEQANVAIIVKYFGFPFCSPLFFLFIGDYIEKPVSGNLLKVSLFIIPIISVILVCTNSYTGIYFENIELITNTRIVHINMEGKIYRTLLFVYIYMIYLASFFTIFSVYIEANEIIRKKLNFLMLAIVVTMLSGILYLLGKSPYEIDSTPIAMTMLSMYVAYYIFIKNVHLSLEHSRYTALENMMDGYILVDENGMYLDANESALNIFPSLKVAKLNSNILDYLDFKSVNELIDGTVDSMEFTLEKENFIIKNYRITVSNLSKNKASKVKCWIIYDISGPKALMSDLEYMANFDPLTGIYNRNKFFDTVNELFKKHLKEKASFAIIMLDIDLFKLVNDTYGHICGDKIIMEVAHRLNGALRKSDVLARYGGEEFVIFVQNIQKKDVINVAIKFNEVINEKSFNFNGKSIDITISVGVSVFDYKNDKSIDEVLLRADNCLYEAKSTGRNKVIIE